MTRPRCPGRVRAALLVAVLSAASGVAASRADEASFLAGDTRSCAGCVLEKVRLRGRDLAGADLSGAKLAGAVFHRARLAGANFAGANLAGTNLNKTDLKNASLANASAPG